MPGQQPAGGSHRNSWALGASRSHARHAILRNCDIRRASSCSNRAQGPAKAQALQSAQQSPDTGTPRATGLETFACAGAPAMMQKAPKNTSNRWFRVRKEKWSDERGRRPAFLTSTAIGNSKERFSLSVCGRMGDDARKNRVRSFHKPGQFCGYRNGADAGETGATCRVEGRARGRALLAG